MDIVRAHVILPARLAQEIDKITGPRGRSAFLVESAEKEIRRIKLEAFLDGKETAWKMESHPELAELGAAACVRNQRQHVSTRQLLVEAWAEENTSC
jgi:hypothetical protein